MRQTFVIKLAIAACLAGSAAPGHADPRADFLASVLHDPDAPVAGNANGDVTIVAFLDYNCPYCRRVTPVLEKVVANDPGVRLVYKDWPILGDPSVLEAQVALAAKYQGKYREAHDALIAIKARPATKEAVRDAVKAVGIDVDRLNKDLASHSEAITALLRRTFSQADAMDLQGTPVFLVGPLKFAQVLDEAGFKQAIADARARQKGGAPH